MDFTWHDGDRTIRFGRGAVDDAPGLLGDAYVVLTTERNADAAPAVVAGATAVHHVAPGRVDELAAELLDEVDGELLVAIGGGRVIDVAKALASARPGRRVAAIPTTLSAAEMTRVHRRAAGAPQDTPPARPQLVINDPALSASQPTAELAASTANALGHAIEAPLTSLASPVPTLAAKDAIRLIGRHHTAATDADRDGLALASLLSGYGIDAAWYGLHHVCSQTLVRLAGVSHGAANATMLPHTTAALRQRRPEDVLHLDEQAGTQLEELAARLAAAAGTTRLRDLGVTEEQLDACADAAEGRPELGLIAPEATRAELRALFGRAF